MANLSPNIYLFVLIACAGLAILLVGGRFSEKIRTAIQTLGLVLFMAGAAGTLYHFVSLNLFVTITSFGVGFILIIDPLKLKKYLPQPKALSIAGSLGIAVSIIYSLAYINRFPPTLWLIPVVLYLLVYLIPSLKARKSLITLVIWLIILAFMGYNGLLVYKKLNPGMNISLGFLDRFINGKGGSSMPDEQITATTSSTNTAPETSSATAINTDSGTATQTAPTFTETSTATQTSPVSETNTATEISATGTDDDMLHDFETLKKLYADEVKKNEALQKEIEKLKEDK